MEDFNSLMIRVNNLYYGRSKISIPCPAVYPERSSSNDAHDVHGRQMRNSNNEVDAKRNIEDTSSSRKTDENFGEAGVVEDHNAVADIQHAVADKSDEKKIEYTSSRKTDKSVGEVDADRNSVADINSYKESCEQSLEKLQVYFTNVGSPSKKVSSCKEDVEHRGSYVGFENSPRVTQSSVDPEDLMSKRVAGFIVKDSEIKRNYRPVLSQAKKHHLLCFTVNTENETTMCMHESSRVNTEFASYFEAVDLPGECVVFC